MIHLDVFLGIAVAFLAILVMVVAAKEKEEVRQLAYMEGYLKGQREGYEKGTSKASLEGFWSGRHERLWKGREIRVKYLSINEILEGIRRYIYICGEDVKDREGHRIVWIKDIQGLNVERSEDYKSVWVQKLKQLNAEKSGEDSYIKTADKENV